MMDLRAAATALGGKVISRNSLTCPGPGHKRADASLSVTFDAKAPDGFLVNSFAGDDWQACRDHVRQMLGLGGFEGRAGHRPVAQPVRDIAPDPVAVQRQDFAAALWAEARPIAGTVAERYLRRRNIDIPGEVYSGEAIRFHPACPFRLDSGETVRLSAMLGAMTNAATGEFQGVHRTGLEPDGSGKASVRGLDNPRKMLGSAAGACVRLSGDDSVAYGLGIAEGLETAMSVMALGFRPVWAALTAGFIARFPVLPGVETLTIFADNDPPKLQGGRLVHAGQEAARQCAARWTAEGRETIIWTPQGEGQDFNTLVSQVSA